jgi:hypothetical protein
MSSATFQPSSAEGFGLSVCESLMTGTPICATVIGGLQDQMGFKKEDGSYLTVNDYTDKWPSNSNGRYQNHGEWAFPLWPLLTLQGSPTTPYIYDSIPSISDITKQMKNMYSLGSEELNRVGELGREFVSGPGMMTAKHMGDLTIKSVDKLFDIWKPRKRFELLETDTPSPEYPSGIILEKN